jgi:NADPH2:quinone reductase
MKAIRVIEHGRPEKLVYQETPAPTITDDQVLIDVHYAGINFPDTLIIQGKYQYQPPLPFTPGGEVSGVVSAVGKNITHVQVGDRVISGCSWGGYAEQVASFATNTFKLPNELPLRDGAVFLQTYATTYHALVDRGQAKKGETILILGAAGGTGTAAIQVAKALELKIIACASTEEKREHCIRQGAEHVLETHDPAIREKIAAITNGKGLDLIYDPIGGAISETVFRSMAFGGRHLIIGFAQGDIPRLPWNLPLLKCASIVGVFWGRFFREFPEENAKNVRVLIDWWSRQILKPVVHQEFPLEQASEALGALIEKKVSGKLVLKVK